MLFPSPRGLGAFSLIEVVLALGVVSTILIPLMGMLAVGLSTSKDSNVDVKTALIAQQWLAVAQMTPYTTAQGSVTKHLDMDGREVPEAQAVFVVRCDYANSQDVLATTNLKKVTITITGPGVGPRTRVFSTTVANLGY